MAHAKTTHRLAHIMDQLGKGYRTRYVAKLPFIMADARGAQDATNEPVADVISSQTKYKGMFVAPVDATILRIFVNAKQYPTTGAGTCRIELYKATIGGADVQLCNTLTISGKTAYATTDAVLVVTAGVTDLIEGQLVYAILYADTVNAKSIGATICMEWMPKDK